MSLTSINPDGNRATMKKMGINPFTLLFNNDEEFAFKEKYFRDSLSQFRIAFFLVMLLYGLFFILDKRIVGEYYDYFFAIRFYFVLPFLLGVFLFSFTKWFERFWQPLLAASFIAAGIGIAEMTTKIPTNYVYYAGMMLIFSAGYFFIKLRFLYATIAGWTTLIIFNLLFIFRGVANLEVSIAEFLFTINFFYISANIIGMMAAYYIELYSRRDFQQQKQLEAERRKIIEINRSLEQKVDERTTELQQKNREITIAKNRAEASDLMKSKFLANVSHELRTPLNAVNGYAQLILLEDSLPQELAENTEEILFNGQKLERMIELIAEISGIESGAVTIKSEKVDLNNLIRTVVESHADSPWIVGKNLEIKSTFDLPDNYPIETIESKRIAQLFENLYENALKFTTQGTVEIGYSKKENHIECFVKDSGAGIPEEYRDIIFNNAMEFAGKETHNDKGAGLGLRFCKLIVSLYDGDIRFDSKPESGTKFHFTIPYTQCK